jgi:hypothetical protein
MPNPTGTGTNCQGGAGVKGKGASCAFTSECAVGFVCVFSACSPICCPSEAASFCGNAGCNVSITVAPGKSIWTCNLAKTCTLFEDGCPEDEHCRMNDSQQELALCAPQVSPLADEGEPCTFINNCGANQVCRGGVCRYSCLKNGWQDKAPGEGGCPENRTCAPDSVTYGVCIP